MGQTNRSRRRERHRARANRRRPWPAWTTGWAEPWIVPLLLIGFVVGGVFAAVMGSQVGGAGWISAAVFAVSASALVLWLIRQWSEMTLRWRWSVISGVITLVAVMFGVSKGEVATGGRGHPPSSGSIGTAPRFVAALTIATVCLAGLSMVLWRLYGRPPKVRHVASPALVPAERADHEGLQAACRCGWIGPTYRFGRYPDAEARAEKDAELHLADVSAQSGS
jgi:hypothetical protein